MADIHIFILLLLAAASSIDDGSMIKKGNVMGKYLLGKYLSIATLVVLCAFYCACSLPDNGASSGGRGISSVSGGEAAEVSSLSASETTEVSEAFDETDEVSEVSESETNDASQTSLAAGASSELSDSENESSSQSSSDDISADDVSDSGDENLNLVYMGSMTKDKGDGNVNLADISNGQINVEGSLYVIDEEKYEGMFDGDLIEDGSHSFSLSDEVKYYSVGGEDGEVECSQSDFMYTVQRYNGLALILYVENGVVVKAEISS